MELPEAPPMKEFKPANGNLPILKDYRGDKSNNYWQHWVKRSYDELTPATSWICANKLLDVARDLDYMDQHGLLRRTMEILNTGANIGCEGDGRLPTRKSNSELSAVYGDRVADALQSWIKEGLCFGPLTPEEMPWEEYTVNPITVKLKPNGKARVCINMSAPYRKDSDKPGTPASVNSGIDISNFPATMSSTQTFLNSLMRTGCPSELAKLDWTNAYKHVAVRMQDHPLQVFEFCGRLFGEVMLTFGCSSSAGLYDIPAKLVKELAISASGTDRRLVNQVLDNCAVCGTKGDGTVNRFYQTYRSLAKKIGVSLADESDADKAFPSSGSGKVLGISYDLENWTWHLADDKLNPLLLALDNLRKNDIIENRSAMSINGKLNHYMWLVHGGPWQRGFLLRTQRELKPPGYKVPVSNMAKEQAAWWIVNLQAGREISRIPDPRPMGNMCPILVYTDAAGGNASKIGNGIGGFCPPNNWFYMPWSDLIRSNRPNSEGTKFAHKMCSLEGLAALVGLATIPNRARNQEVHILCDNSAFVAAYRKKHSTCAYAYTVAKAINDVGEGLGCVVKIVKTKRCSSPGANAADALSKADWDRAWDLIPNKDDDPGRIPASILRWASNPTKDMTFGKKILCDMSKYTKVLHLDQ